VKYWANFGRTVNVGQRTSVVPTSCRTTSDKTHLPAPTSRTALRLWEAIGSAPIVKAKALTRRTQMSLQIAADASASQFEIRFESLFDAGRGMSFPCDPQGHVDLDSLPARARNNYLFARAMVGKDYLPPAVRGRNSH
jgi:hypothetical protein